MNKTGEMHVPLGTQIKLKNVPKGLYKESTSKTEFMIVGYSHWGRTFGDRPLVRMEMMIPEVINRPFKASEPALYSVAGSNYSRPGSPFNYLLGEDLRQVEIEITGLNPGFTNSTWESAAKELCVIPATDVVPEFMAARIDLIRTSIDQIVARIGNSRGDVTRICKPDMPIGAPNPDAWPNRFMLNVVN
jgi:hypothetical protein